MEPLNEVKLKALTDAYLDSLLTDLPSEAELASQQVLSKRFLNRMDLLTGSRHRTPRTWKKMLLVAAIISAILATAVSVYAYREAIAAFFINVYEKYSEIIIPTTTETNDPSDVTEPGNSLTDNLPTHVPAEYREKSRQTLIGMLQITYTNDAGDILLFEKMEQGSQHIGINTEGVEIEELTVDGCQALYYSNLGQNNLIWADGAYIYTITGFINQGEIVKMAISGR
ncbi:MAG TPA: hypothetical protein DCM45_03635 [Clostridiales bacterium]|nr:hypothetical protein [Clostridiales bacterium]